MAVRPCLWVVLLLLLLPAVAAPQDRNQNGPGPNQEPPRSAPQTHSSNESSSRDNIIDLSPPENDAKAHPESGDVMEDSASEVGEFRPFDPHRAQKDIEIGDFYFKRQNYRAAIDRYREALWYKPNDAIATYALAESLEKIGNVEEAQKNYEAYLKILPHGPSAADAKKAIDRLKGASSAASGTASSPTPKLAKAPKK
jgi:tetratricopeptide (TPR) repeat protein